MRVLYLPPPLFPHKPVFGQSKAEEFCIDQSGAGEYYIYPPTTHAPTTFSLQTGFRPIRDRHTLK